MDENGVVAAVCSHLTNNGYAILQRLRTTSQGIDIIAKHPSSARRLLIEAKGGTSSRVGSPRFGKPYDENQVIDRVGKGFYTAGCLYSQHGGSGDEIALAFPDLPLFRKHIIRAKPAFLKLRITVFLVDPNTHSVIVF
jgi:hypothetical protein